MPATILFVPCGTRREERGESKELEQEKVEREERNGKDLPLPALRMRPNMGVQPKGMRNAWRNDIPRYGGHRFEHHGTIDEVVLEVCVRTDAEEAHDLVSDGIRHALCVAMIDGVLAVKDLQKVRRRVGVAGGCAVVFGAVFSAIGAQRGSVRFFCLDNESNWM